MCKSQKDCGECRESSLHCCGSGVVLVANDCMKIKHVSPEIKVMRGSRHRGTCHFRSLSSTSPKSQVSVNKRSKKMLGKLVHLGFDALLISAFLAGIKRTTSLTCVPLEPSRPNRERQIRC